MASRQFSPGSAMNVNSALTYSAAQTYNAAITAVSTATLNSGLTFQPGGTGNTYTITAATPAANRSYALPDAASGEVVVTTGAQNVSLGNISTSGNINISGGYSSEISSIVTRPTTGGSSTGNDLYAYRFSITDAIRVKTFKSNGDTWGSGGNRTFTFWNNDGSTVIFTGTVSSGDPFINNMFVKTLASPFTLPAGTYTVGINRVSGDTMFSTGAVFDPLITYIDSAYSIGYVYPTFTIPFLTPATDGYFDFDIMVNYASIGSGDAVFSNSLQLQPNGFGTKFTITCTNPAANRTYTLPDAGAAADLVLTEGNRTINGDTVLGNDLDVNGELFVIGDTTTTGNFSAFGYGTTYHQTNSVVPTGSGTTTAAGYTHGWRFSIPLGIRMVTAKSATTSWGGGGTTRNFRVFDSVGTLLFNENISNTDPVVSGMYVHTFSVPLDIPAGTYTVATVRNGGDNFNDTVTFDPFITEIPPRAYSPTAGAYPDPAGPYFANAIDAFFDFYIQGPVVGALTSVATFSNGVDLQLDGFSTKYTISYGHPTADRIYAMPDLTVDGMLTAEETTILTSNYTDNGGGTTYITGYSHTVTRKNNQVTITFGTDSTTFTGTSTQVKTATPLAARFRPIAAAQSFPGRVASNGTNQFGYVSVGTDGVITWYRDAAQTAWAGTANDRFYASSITYNIV